MFIEWGGWQIYLVKCIGLTLCLQVLGLLSLLPLLQMSGDPSPNGDLWEKSTLGNINNRSGITGHSHGLPAVCLMVKEKLLLYLHSAPSGQKKLTVFLHAPHEAWGWGIFYLLLILLAGQGSAAAGNGLPLLFSVPPFYSFFFLMKKERKSLPIINVISQYHFSFTLVLAHLAWN